MIHIGRTHPLFRIAYGTEEWRKSTETDWRGKAALALIEEAELEHLDRMDALYIIGVFIGELRRLNVKNPEVKDDIRLIADLLNESLKRGSATVQSNAIPT